MIGWLKDRAATWAVRRFIGLGKPEFLIGALVGQRTHAGVTVTPDMAMTCSGLKAGVRVLSEDLASLPLILYERVAGGRRRASDHPVYSVAHDQPNPRMTSFVFRETVQAVTMLWGNGYARIERDALGRAVRLTPLPAGKVKPVEVTAEDEVIYEVEDFDNTRSKVPARRLLHIPGLGFDGIQGRSVLRDMRETIGSCIATERFGATFFGNNSIPGGLLRSDKNLNADQARDYQRAWEEQHRGDKQNRIAVLMGGLTYEKIGIPPEDAQFLESRKFHVSEFARHLRIPPHMIGDLEKATFSNIEQQALDYVKHSLRPWLVRWEQELNRKLLNGADQDRFFFEFNVEGLLRGDTKSRYEAYRIGRQWGWLSANDIRRLENMNEIDGGDEYLVPLNMIPAGSAAQLEPSQQAEALRLVRRSLVERLREAA